MKILILDDEPRNSAGICRTLEDLGYRIDNISTSKEAYLKLEESELPDLGLFDIRLDGDPVLWGTNVAKKFIQDFHIPIILYSRYSNEGDLAQKAIDSGVPNRFFIDRNQAENPIFIQTIIEEALTSYEMPKPSMFEYLNYTNRVIGLFCGEGGERVYKFVHKEEIMFLKSNDRYTDIHLEDEKIMITRNIGNIGSKINRIFYNIVRVDRSYYINLEQLSKLEGVSLYFTNGEYIRLSDAAKSFLRRNNIIIDAQ